MRVSFPNTRHETGTRLRRDPEEFISYFFISSACVQAAAELQLAIVMDDMQSASCESMRNEWVKQYRIFQSVKPKNEMKIIIPQVTNYDSQFLILQRNKSIKVHGYGFQFN